MDGVWFWKAPIIIRLKSCTRARRTFSLEVNYNVANRMLNFDDSFLLLKVTHE